VEKSLGRGPVRGQDCRHRNCREFTYLAYLEPVKTGNTRFKLLSLGAAKVGSIVAFTVISSYPFNEAINQQLGEIEGETSPSTQGNGKEDFKQLVVDWGRLDYY
jgi:hypothetical protein